MDDRTQLRITQWRKRLELRVQVVDDVAQGLAVGEVRVEPWLETVVVQGERHAVVDLGSSTAGGFGQDGAAWRTAAIQVPGATL